MIIILQLIIVFNSVQAEFLFFQARGVLQNCSSDCSHDQSKKCANAKCTGSSAIKIAYLKEQKSVLFAITGDTGCSSKRTTTTQTSVQFSSVQSLSRIQLFATPWIAARQASLSITNSQSSLRLRSIESVMPSRILLKKGLLVDWVF